MGEVEKHGRTFARTVRRRSEMGRRRTRERARERTRERETRLVIEAATLAPMKELAARLAAFRDVDAACALLFMQGRKPTEVARELARTCAPGGEADRLADRLADPREARRYVRRLAATFAPFAEILRGLNVTADGHKWMRTGRGYFQREADAVRRKRDGMLKREAKRQRREERAREKAEIMKLGGIYYTEDGRKVYGVNRVSGIEACAIFGRGRTQIAAWANAGKIERVYIGPKRRRAVGYLRESVERYVATGGIYYTAAGQIVGAERMSRREAKQLLNVSEVRVSEMCRRGEITRVYADPALTIPRGFLRASVEAWAQAHPRRAKAETTRTEEPAAGRDDLRGPRS